MKCDGVASDELSNLVIKIKSEYTVIRMMYRGNNGGSTIDFDRRWAYEDQGNARNTSIE